MRFGLIPLFGQTASLGQSATVAARSTFEWGRIQSDVDWFAPAAVAVLTLAYVIWMYRRDTRELSQPRRVLLAGLRLAAFGGLLLVYLQPQWRNERDRIEPSRVVLLFDTSLSMQLRDANESGTPGEQTRSEQVAAFLNSSPFLTQLRQRHDVVAMRFDEATEQFATLSQISQSEKPTATEAASATPWQGQYPLYVALAAIAVFATCVLLTLLLRSGSAGRITVAFAWASAAAVVIAAASALWIVQNNSRDQLLALLALDSDPPTPTTASTDAQPVAIPEVDWTAALKPQGIETRMGDASRRVLAGENADTLAGVVLVTDGQQNAGLDPVIAANLAGGAKTPIYLIGVGSEYRPVELWVSDFQAARRAYPGDNYTATGYVQARGLAGRTVTAQIVSRAANNVADADAGVVEGTQQITLGPDGEATVVKFELSPKEVGVRTLVFRIDAPRQDQNPQDNQDEARVEIVDRKTKALLMAGGPAREYQFLRNQLMRDREFNVDVLLQTAQPGISQDADAILDAFPDSPEALGEYDVIVAFDVNWGALDNHQLGLLRRWVGEQAGGLVLVSGPIHSPAVAQDKRLEELRELYPVEFHRRISVGIDDRFGSTEPWPIEFTRDGREAEFLWLEDGAALSSQAWSEFDGVYGYFNVKGPKRAGATVYGTYSDPRASAGDGPPIYLASQIYGSGRVFYMGSAEMWRLRAAKDAYFESFYTKLLRWVSQGRLLRGSNRGVLLTERDTYSLGATVAVSAQVTDAQFQPLDAPALTLEVIAPDSTVETAVLKPIDPARPGNFRGEFTVEKEGSYRLELPLPGSEERLSGALRARLPDRENENRSRNDALMSELADRSGGAYYVGFNAVLSDTAQPALPAQLKDRSQTVTQLAMPERLWDNRWMMWTICGLLCLEWLTRRLSKLA